MTDLNQELKTALELKALVQEYYSLLKDDYKIKKEEDLDRLEEVTQKIESIAISYGYNSAFELLENY